MEFWGVEVKAGEKVPVTVEDGHLIHLSQVALGDVKNAKSANYVPVRLTVEGKKFVIGTLSADKGPQISFDLVFDKDFELSHDWKDGSIYFCGYIAEQEDGTEGPDGYFDEEDDSSDEEEIELENGKLVPAVPAAKPTETKAAATKAGSSAKPKVTVVEPKKVESEDDSDDSDSSESDQSEDESTDNDADDMSEDEETPQKVEPPSKKRPASSAVKTPASTKKAKTETPQKTDGKKASVHTATPHPKKKSEKKTTESPKSTGLSCSTCSKTFNSEKGLESHTKAKHAGK